MIETSRQCPTANQFRCYFTSAVRFGDHDCDGFLSDTAIARFIEEARLHLLQEAMAKVGLNWQGGQIGMLIAKVNIEMIAHCIPNENIGLGAGISRIGKSSITLRVGIFCGNVCVALAENVMVITNRKNGRPNAIAPDLVEEFKSYAVE